MSEPADDSSSAVESLVTVLSGGALVSGGKIFAIGFGFLTQIVMARLLTEAEYGSVVLVISVVNLTALLAKLGLDDGVMREFPHYEDEPSKAKGVARAGLIVAAGSGIALGALVFFFSPFLAQRVFNDASLIPLFRIGSIGVPFITTSSVAVSLARGGRDARVQAYVQQVFRPSTRLLFVGGLLLAGFSTIGAVSGQIVSFVLAALLAFYMARNSLPTFDVSAESMYRPLLTFSVPLIAIQGMGFLNGNIDIYMVGYFMESDSLGVYNIALQFGTAVIGILGAAGFLLPPMLTRLSEQGKRMEMRRTYQVLTKWMVVLILPIFVVLFFAPKLVIGFFFGSSYTSGALALQILIVGKIYAIIMGLNGQALIALGKNRVVSYIVFCETAVNVVLNYTLIPIIGFEGAAIGMTVSTLIGDILGVAILYRLFGLHPFTSNVLSPVVATGTIGALSYGVLWTLNLPTYLTILVVGIAYLPLVARLAPDPEDEKLLAHVEEQTGYNLGIVRRTISTLR